MKDFVFSACDIWWKLTLYKYSLAKDQKNICLLMLCVYMCVAGFISLFQRQKKRGPLLLEINVVCLVTNPTLKTQLLSILMLQLPALHIIIILVHLYGHAIQINGCQTMIIIIIIIIKARDKPWKKFVVLKFWRKSHDSWGLDNHSTSMHALTYNWRTKRTTTVWILELICHNHRFILIIKIIKS